MDADAYANDRLHQQRRRFRGPTWMEAFSRNQSHLLAIFLQGKSPLKLASSQDETASQGLDRIQTTLSYDLIYQIFMFLPAESLFRLQFVCKELFSLFNNAAFIASHAQQSETILMSQKLSFWHQGNQRSYFHFLNLDELTCNFVESSVAELTTIRASYDGLILASTGDQMSLTLMNPVTGKHIELPLGATCHPLWESFGMAFCNLANTYKVVHIFRETSMSIGCEILSIRTRNWTRIQGYPELLRVRQIPVSIGGSLHWLSSTRRDYFVSINVQDEKFVSKQLPVRRVGTDRLLEIGGNLGFVAHAELKSWDIGLLQVWILVADGETGEHWMKRYSINLAFGLINCIPICSRRNGQEMVLESACHQLYVYNHDKHEMKPVPEYLDEPWAGGKKRRYMPHRNTIVPCGNHSLVTS